MKQAAWFQNTDWWKYYQRLSYFELHVYHDPAPPFVTRISICSEHSREETWRHVSRLDWLRAVWHRSEGVFWRDIVRDLLGEHYGEKWIPFSNVQNRPAKATVPQWECLYCGGANNNREGRDRLTQCKYCGAPRPIGACAPLPTPAYTVSTTYFASEVPAPARPQCLPEGFTDVLYY